MEIDEKDPAYQLESGATGSLLTEEWWARGLFDEKEQEEVGDS